MIILKFVIPNPEMHLRIISLLTGAGNLRLEAGDQCAIVTAKVGELIRA